MTPNERVLALLKDRQPHTHHELYSLYVVAHSRISDLRKQGYEIAQWRDGDSYVYQLVGGPPVEPTLTADVQLSLAPPGAYDNEAA